MYALAVCLPVKSLQLCLILCNPMDCSHQAPLSMGFSRQEYCSGLPCLLQGIFPTQGLNQSLISPALEGRFFTLVPPGKQIHA